MKKNSYGKPISLIYFIVGVVFGYIYDSQFNTFDKEDFIFQAARISCIDGSVAAVNAFVKDEQVKKSCLQIAKDVIKELQNK